MEKYMQLFVPNYIFKKAEDITPQFLKENGITTLALDVDNTITTHGNMAVSDSMRAWLDEMQDVGINLYIVSNNKFERVSPLAINLNLPYTHFSIKPLPNAFRKVCRECNATPQELAVVGDQIFTDVLGGNLFGATTIMVEPIRKETTLYFKIKRAFEQPFVKKYYKMKNIK